MKFFCFICGDEVYDGLFYYLNKAIIKDSIIQKNENSSNCLYMHDSCFHREAGPGWEKALKSKLTKETILDSAKQLNRYIHINNPKGKSVL